MLHVSHISSLHFAAVDRLSVVLYNSTGKKDFDVMYNNVNRKHDGPTAGFTSLHHLPGTL